MSKYTTEQIRQVVKVSAVYSTPRPLTGFGSVEDSYEDIRIDFTEDTYFVGTGEETGREYRVDFDDIDLDEDSFQRLTNVDVAEILALRQ